MELGIVLIGIATFMNSVILAWVISSNKGRTGSESTQNLPLTLIEEIREWQDAAELTSAVVTATNETHTYSNSAWENKSGIQQGVTSAPAPPIVQEPLPPLARPQGFV